MALPRTARLAAEAVAATLLWFTWLALVGTPATVVAADVLPTGVGVAMLAAVAVGAISGGDGPRRVRPIPFGVGIVVLMVAVGIVTAPAADAHDPGQGRPADAAVLSVERIDGISASVALTVEPGEGSRSCADLVAVRSAARSAGITRLGTLAAVGPCRYEGVVAIDAASRWFVYVELDDGASQLETWAPLARGERQATVRRSLYEPPVRPAHALQRAGGLAVYALAGAMVVLAVRSARHIGSAGADDASARSGAL